MSNTPLVAFDLEVDTSGDPTGRTVKPGLDPRFDRITTLAVVGTGGLSASIEAPDGQEAMIFASADAIFRTVGPCVTLSFNGYEYDLPFMKVRAKTIGVPDPGISLSAEAFAPQRISKYGSLEWTATVPFSRGRGAEMAPTWNSARIRGNHHADLAQMYRLWAIAAGVTWSLEGIACAVLGVPKWKVDRNAMHELTPAERAAYGMTDTAHTHSLGEAAVDMLGTDWSRFLRPSAAASLALTSIRS